MPHLEVVKTTSGSGQIARNSVAARLKSLRAYRSSGRRISSRVNCMWSNSSGSHLGRVSTVFSNACASLCLGPEKGEQGRRWRRSGTGESDIRRCSVRVRARSPALFAVQQAQASSPLAGEECECWVASGRGGSETGPYTGDDARTGARWVGDPPLRETGLLGWLGCWGLCRSTRVAGYGGRLTTNGGRRTGVGRRAQLEVVDDRGMKGGGLIELR